MEAIDTKNGDRIIIHKVENGFEVAIDSGTSCSTDRRFVYNCYQDLIRDLNDFLAKEEEEEEEEEKSIEEEYEGPLN